MCETNQRAPEMNQSISVLRVHVVRARDMHAQTKSLAIAYLIPPSATCIDDFQDEQSTMCIFVCLCTCVWVCVTGAEYPRDQVALAPCVRSISEGVN
jgi:hypothetical protein